MIAEIGSLLATVISLMSIWLYGQKRLLGPLLGASAFIPWMMVALGGAEIIWGLIPANVIFASMHVRNALRWNRDRV